MSDRPDLAAKARAIIDTNLYMVLATADEAGQPWASPVYYAPVGYRDLLWVSSPERRHSQNLEARDAVSIVIFDSSVPINSGQGVYLSAVARQVPDDELADSIDVFSQRSLGHGGGPFTADDVKPPARLRLYRAISREHWVLDADDNRQLVEL